MKRNALLIPFIIFLVIAAALLWQLARNAQGDDPTTGTDIPSGVAGEPGSALSGRCAYAGQAGTA